MATATATTRLVSGLAALVARLENAKDDEAAAREARIEAEAQIVAACGFSQAEGSATFRDADDKEIRVTLTQPVNRSVDQAAWKSIEADLPPSIREVVRWKPEVSITSFRALDSDALALVAPAITSKPGKISVEVK